VRKNKITQLSFWQYQILGWILAKTTIDVQVLFKTIYLRKEIDMNVVLQMFCIDLVAFSLTIGMRYLYRYVYKKELYVFWTILIVAFVSYVAAVITFMSILPISELFHIAQKPIEIPGALSSIMWNFPIFFVWSLLYFGIKYWNQSLQDRDKAAQANLLAQSAQLQMLRYQLNPHFLFNSLNSVWALIDEDKKASKEMISELAEFLRYSLVSKNYSDVPLKHELEAIRLYFSIEKKRFEEKLDVTFEIDPEAEDYPVLSFLVHPLVENAVKYGMKTSQMPLKIVIYCKKTDGDLHIQVKNTGKWYTPQTGNTESTGTGLKNIQLRLDNAFPGRSSLKVEPIEGWVVAKIDIYKKV